MKKLSDLHNKPVLYLKRTVKKQMRWQESDKRSGLAVSEGPVAKM